MRDNIIKILEAKEGEKKNLLVLGHREGSAKRSVYIHEFLLKKTQRNFKNNLTMDLKFLEKQE
jgi:hypothetical protein